MNRWPLPSIRCLAESLLSLVYAIDLGDPDGTILLAGNVAHRHDFGLGVIDRDARARSAWAMPHQEVAPGVPWHVAGSALGLELALAPLSLRRTDTGRIGGAPRLTSNERQTFAMSVALLNPFAFEDSRPRRESSTLCSAAGVALPLP